MNKRFLTYKDDITRSNRRSFLKSFFVGIVAVPLVLATIRNYEFDGKDWKEEKKKVENTDYLMGYKGAEFLNDGYVYCPYIPIYYS